MTSFHKCIPAKFEKKARNAAEAVSRLDKVIIAAHINPDGDAVGAAAACGYILKAIGRQFAFYAPGGIPKYLDFLELPGPIYARLEDIPFKPESAIYVDCSDAKRLGPELEPMAGMWPSVNIDHHLCEAGLGTLANFIENSAGAACQLVAYVAMELGLPMQGNLGKCIGVGLLTDTGQFAHGSTNADIFSLCSCLEECGCSFAELADSLHHVWTLQRLHIWGRCFLRIRLEFEGKIACCVLTREEQDSEGIGKDDMEGFVDTLRRIVGVEIAVFGREQEGGQTRFSLRSRGKVSVQEISSRLGGGGHRNAAGLTIDADAERAREIVLAACKDYLSNYAKEQA